MSQFKLLDYLTDDNKYNNFFEIFHFFININFDLSNMKDGDIESYEEYSKLLHEFTHYFQGICTVYGVYSIEKYFEFQVDILTKMCEKINKDENYSTNFFKSFFDGQYKEHKDNYVYDNSFIGNDNHSIYSIFTKKIENPILQKNQYEHFIKLENDYNLHISPKCLRETMAMMTYFHFMKLNKLESLDYLIS